MIDIVKIKSEVKKGNIVFYVNRNRANGKLAIYCTDPENGECVCVNEDVESDNYSNLQSNSKLVF